MYSVHIQLLFFYKHNTVQEYRKSVMLAAFLLEASYTCRKKGGSKLEGREGTVLFLR
jgi:hypothetical protein